MIEYAQPVLLAGYLLFGVWLAARMVLTDTEITHLPGHLARARRDHEADLGCAGHQYPIVGGVMRFPWRMPGEYWLFRWVPWLPPRWQLGCARGFSLIIGAVGVWATMAHATALGGPWAGTLTGMMIASQATLVGTAATASYQSTVALLWEIGVSGVAPVTAGVGLALVRHTSFPMAALLWALTWTRPALIAALLVTALIVWRYPGVVQNLIRPTRLRAPRDVTWMYAIKTAVQRYESFVVWVPLALVGWRATPWRLIAISFGTLAVTHGRRAQAWPKLVVGHLYDFHLPIVVALAVMLASVPTTPWMIGAIACATLWGLVRPRHPALPR